MKVGRILFELYDDRQQPQAFEMVFDPDGVDSMLWLLKHDREWFLHEFCAFAAQAFIHHRGLVGMGKKGGAQADAVPAPLTH